MTLTHLLLEAPNLVNGGFDSLDKFFIHLLLVVEKPRTCLCLRHITQDHHRVIEGVLAKVGLDATIGRECFIFELLVINELGFVDKQPRERKGVRRAGTVLRDNDRTRAVVEGQYMFVLGWFNDCRAKGLGRLASDNVVYAVFIAPPFECGENTGNGIR